MFSSLGGRREAMRPVERREEEDRVALHSNYRSDSNASAAKM